ncbi:PQQ-binding-like beta-propeller repeat protein [Streptomyces sp. NPDC002265]|uniref:outer membrane protein assembly factor BamB family protein n=1 Tax=Streptomyces sp. NPDC002265 TaxID=3154415 RepID=UPI003322021C
MTTESSPGQGAPQEDGWAFRPRRPTGAPQPHREQRQTQPYRREQQQTQPYRKQQQTQPSVPWDDRSQAEWDDRSQAEWDDPSQAEPYGSSGTRWDATMPLRVPEPRTDDRAPREPGHRTPPQTRRGGEPAGQGYGYPPATAAVLDPEFHHRPEPVAVSPQPPAGADGSRSGRTRWGRIVLTLAVLVAAGATASVLVKQEDAAAVASKQLTREWQIPAPASDDALIGSWLTDKLLVRAGSQGGLRAYDLTDGKQVWKAARLPAAAKHATVPCAMSPTLGAQGIGTVAFGPDSSACTWLAGVDAATGKILWSLPLTSAKHPTAATATTHVQGDVATVVSENFLGGVDLRTGSRVWGYKARGHYCNAYDWGVAGTVLVDDFCLDKKNRFTLTAYDGETGKVIWRKSERAHSEVTHILSGSPLVATVHTTREDAVRVFDTEGTGRKLAVGNDELTSGNESGADHSARLYGKVLVTPALAAGRPVLDGFDTTTGAKLWTVRSAALAVPASGADDTVYAVTTSGAPQLVTIDPRTGRTTPVAGLPVGTGKWNFTSGTVYVTADGGVLELNALGSNGGVRLYR